MSFFEEIEPTTTFESASISKVIPDGIKLLCAVASANWKDADQYNEASIDVTLHVIERGEYKDLLKKDNLKVNHEDYDKATKAKTKLLAYDTMGKGLLFKTAKNRSIEDDDAILNQALAGVELVATFAVWEMEDKKNPGQMNVGNWVRKIEPKPKALQEEDKHIEAQAKNQPNAPVSVSVDDYDDDTHF